jgi:hypothetical protein
MPKTKEEVAKLFRSAAIKKYKSYSVEKLDAEIERIKNKKTKSAKDMIDWSVLKGLKKRQTEKPQTLPTLSRKPYITEYKKYSVKQVIKEQKRLSEMSIKRMPVNEILARQDALKEVISNIPDAEFDKLDKPKTAPKTTAPKTTAPKTTAPKKTPARGRKPPPEVGALKWKMVKETSNDKENSWEWEATGDWIAEPGESTTYSYFQDTLATEDKYWDGEEIKKGNITDENGVTYTVPEFKRKYNALQKKFQFKMTARERSDLIFQWELWWRKNGASGLKDYMIMPTRVANNAFKSRNEIEDKNKREKIFSKLQELIDDGNTYDGTTWKTITAKDVKDAVSS